MDKVLRDFLVVGAGEMGVSLDAVALERFSTYLGLLQLWGRKINLTSRLESREVVLHHFLDSLSGATWLRQTPAARVVDIGTGAGFPAIPLKIALPGLELFLIESTRKKVLFCREVIRAANLVGIEVVCGRAEELGRNPRYAGRFDWAMSRAVGQAADLVVLALPLLRENGKILLYKSRPSAAELAGLERTCLERELRWETHRANVPGLEEERIHIIVSRP